MIRRGPAVALAGVLAVVSAGCMDGSSPASPTTTTVALPPGVTPTPGPESPFCTGVNGVLDRLENDPPDDVPAYLAETYQELLGVAPAEMVPVLEALIATNGGGPSVETTLPDGTVPDNVTPTVIVASAADRLTDYFDAHCSRVAANPGPADTVPDAGPDTTRAG